MTTEATENKIRIDGVEYDVPDDLTLGESMLVKQVSGLGVTEFFDALEVVDGGAMAALVLIVMRRAGKKVELEDIEGIKLSDFQEVGGNGDRPPAAAGDGESETIPDGSGSPTSDESSDSDLQT